jgi:exodeoxyribonuclease VII large subunit
MTILALVQVSYSELYGLSLVVEDLDAEATLGEQEKLRRETIARLEEEGLLEAQQGLGMAALPYRLAVISARDAAGWGDFERHLRDNAFGFRFCPVLFEATMQGPQAPESISDALDRIAASESPFDAVLIMRGGGSSFDLSCFDDYGLCFNIASYPVPVLTAIGHDRDRHVADMVSYLSFKTPTALADFFIDAYAAEDERIGSYIVRLRLAFIHKLDAMGSKVELLLSRIKAADPRGILARGYVLATDARGVVLKSAAGVSAGDKVGVLFSDGKLNCTVDGKV